MKLLQISMFNWADYAIIGIVVISILISLMRGFVREAVSLMTWILAFLVAFKFSDSLAGFLTSYVKTESFRTIIAFAILFVFVLVLGAMVNLLIVEFISSTGLGGTDRLLGMFFGALRGVLLVAVVLLLGTMTSLVNDSWWKESLLIPHFQGLVSWLHVFLPDKFASINTAGQAIV